MIGMREKMSLVMLYTNNCLLTASTVFRTTPKSWGTAYCYFITKGRIFDATRRNHSTTHSPLQKSLPEKKKYCNHIVMIGMRETTSLMMLHTIVVYTYSNHCL